MHFVYTKQFIYVCIYGVYACCVHDRIVIYSIFIHNICINIRVLYINLFSSSIKLDFVIEKLYVGRIASLRLLKFQTIERCIYIYI